MSGARRLTLDFVGLILFCVIWAAPAYAQRQFQASFTGAQQVPVVASPGTGSGTVVLNADETQITVNMSFSGLTSPAILAHIHGAAPVGANANVLFDFSAVTPNATSGSIPEQTFAITPAQVAELKAGLYYFNVHTTNFGGGEIRGQIFVSMTTNPTSLRAGATKSGSSGALVQVTPCQPVTVRLPGTAAGWVASVNQPWVQLANASGTGTGRFSVCVSDPANALGAATSATATITLSAASISQTLTVPVVLAIHQVGTTAAPFGSFDTPAAGAAVEGSIAVTGWAIDDIGVNRVEIWRDTVAGETTPPYPGPGPGNGKVFIANAFFVTGARPDVEVQFGSMPAAARAGWGYLLLTQGLWNQGNGPYTLYAFAYDQEGRSISLGSKAITASNATASKPFGGIDVPAYGQTMTTSFFNFGWALTPNATPSCTIPSTGVQVSIDSGPLQTVSYGDLRPDIAAAFPGFTNGSGAGGAFFIDISSLSNGTHQIGWYVVDNCLRAEGIGSRFFDVLNEGSTLTVAPNAPMATIAATSPAEAATEPIEVRRESRTSWIFPSRSGDRVMAIGQSDRIEMRLPEAGGGPYAGYQIVNGERRELPLGSSLDAANGVFYWQPAAGFLGAHQLEFESARGGIVRVRAVVGTHVEAVIDTPSAGGVPSSFVVSGWAVDLAAANGSGIDTVHIWAYPVSGAQPIFLGVARYGDARYDIGALFGDQFTRASYSLPVTLRPGAYDVVVYPHSTVMGDFRGAKVQRVVVRGR